MWSVEQLELDAEIIRLRDRFLVLQKKPISAILQMAIMQSVYLAYNPSTYVRTNQLIRCVNTEIINGVLYVFLDTRRAYYESVYGFEVTDAVPYYVEFGHEAHNYTPHPLVANNQFHRYMPPRHYLELAQSSIKGLLGIDVEIVLNIPI